MTHPPTERPYLEDNIATVAFHLGQPGARLTVSYNDGPRLAVDPGEVLKEVSRRLTAAPQSVSTETADAALYRLLASNIPDCMDSSWEGRMIRPERLTALVGVILTRFGDAVQAEIDRDTIGTLTRQVLAYQEQLDQEPDALAVAQAMYDWQYGKGAWLAPNQQSSVRDHFTGLARIAIKACMMPSTDRRGLLGCRRCGGWGHTPGGQTKCTLCGGTGADPVQDGAVSSTPRQTGPLVPWELDCQREVCAAPECECPPMSPANRGGAA